MDALLQFANGAVMHLPVSGEEVLRLEDGERITMFDLIQRPMCGPWVYREAGGQ